MKFYTIIIIAIIFYLYDGIELLNIEFNSYL